jgi:hypothetical protein
MGHVDRVCGQRWNNKRTATNSGGRFAQNKQYIKPEIDGQPKGVSKPKDFNTMSRNVRSGTKADEVPDNLMSGSEWLEINQSEMIAEAKKTDLGDELNQGCYVHPDRKQHLPKPRLKPTQPILGYHSKSTAQSLAEMVEIREKARSYVTNTGTVTAAEFEVLAKRAPAYDHTTGTL